MTYKKITNIALRYLDRMAEGIGQGAGIAFAFFCAYHLVVYMYGAPQ